MKSKNEPCYRRYFLRKLSALRFGNLKERRISSFASFGVTGVMCRGNRQEAVFRDKADNEEIVTAGKFRVKSGWPKDL